MKTRVGIFLCGIRESLFRIQVKQIVLDGVAHQVDLGGHVHFGKNVRLVGADRFDAQRKFFGYGGQADATHDAGENFVLPVAQQVCGCSCVLGETSMASSSASLGLMNTLPAATRRMAGKIRSLSPSLDR